MVANDGGNVGGFPQIVAGLTRSFSPGAFGQRGSDEKSELESNRSEFIWKSTRLDGLSRQAKEFITSGGHPNTKKTYDSGWRIFAQWWKDQGFPKRDIYPSDVVNFLVEMFQAGKSASQCNSYRSAISMTAPHFEGKPLGQHELVVQVMNKIQFLHLTEPRYMVTWNTDQVVEYILKMGPTNQLGMAELRAKSIMLLRLATIARSSDIYYILFSSIQFHDQEMKFKKRAWKNQRNMDEKIFSVRRFEMNRELCPVATLEAYVQATRDISRPSDRVYVSIKAPIKEITTQRIAKITLEVMKAAGIDVGKFKAHSTRSASASKAIEKGMSVDEVMALAGWRSRGVFNAFYNRAILQTNPTEAILSMD